MVESKFLTTVNGFPNSDDKLKHDMYAIVLSRGIMTHADKNASAKTEVFEFYASYNDYVERQKTSMLTGKNPELKKEDIPDVVKCIFGDGLSGLMPFEEFKNEFGYEDCCEAHKVWKACKANLNKLLNLGFKENELYEIVNRLIDLENDNKLSSIFIL